MSNLADKKGASAVFGGLSFVWVYEFREDGAPASAKICVLATGRFHREGERVDMADPFSIREAPVDFHDKCLQRVINLSDVARKVSAFGKFLNEEAGSHIQQLVQNQAQEMRIATESLLQHASADGMFVIEMTYNYLDLVAPVA